MSMDLLWQEHADGEAKMAMISACAHPPSSVYVMNDPADHRWCRRCGALWVLVANWSMVDGVMRPRPKWDWVSPEVFVGDTK